MLVMNYIWDIKLKILDFILDMSRRWSWILDFILDMSRRWSWTL